MTHVSNISIAAAHGRSHATRPAFTLVELLMVMAIVMVLLSLILVGMNRAARTAQRTNTLFLMNSISQGLVQFKQDFGYFPPVLGDGRTSSALRDLRRPYDAPTSGNWASDSDYVTEIQQYHSATSLTEYLIGYGNHNQDGYGVVAGAPNNNDWSDESPPLGIRDPGADGVWGATLVNQLGRLADRMTSGGTEALPKPVDRGQVRGPYIALEDERLLGTVDSAYRVRLPGEGGFDMNEVDGTGNGLQAGVFLDYWGSPITYFRRAYPLGAIKQPLYPRDIDGDGQSDQPPNLSDVIILRPYDLPADSGTNSRVADASGDPTTTFGLRSAEFALFSPGADRTANPMVRVDDPDDPAITTSFSNEDNIVVTGP